MLVVPEIDELFLPLPDYFLVNLQESMNLVTKLLDDLPAMFAKSQRVDSALSAALRGAYGVMVKLNFLFVCLSVCLLDGIID
jgi:protein transport protein SEC24